MRTLLIAGWVLCSTANAQVVEVECPTFYPPKDAVLADAPDKHKGKGVVEKRELYDVGLFGGEFGGKMQLLPGYEKKVKGGTDNIDFSPPTWLVCYYRGGVSWWEEVNIDKLVEKGQIKEGCVLQTREGGKSIKLICH